MKFILVFVFSLWVFPLHAWNLSDHQAIGRIALQEVAGNWALDRPVAVHPLDPLLKKLPPEIGDPWRFSSWLGINPAIDISRPLPEHLGRARLTPLEILSAYAVDPDDGRDEDLFNRDKKGRPVARYKDQKWFGSLSGPSSRAFRHIEKPPFSFRHPVSTFGIPFRAVGEATRRTEIWFYASQLAFALDEDYWGWRFLANALHYLQDLHNPYHAAQITPRLFLKGNLAYLQWGRSFGWIGTFAHLLSNSHGFYENLIEQSGRLAQEKEEVLNALKGSGTLPSPGGPEPLALRARDESNPFFPRLLDAVTRASDPKLLTSYTYAWWDPQNLEPPEKLLRIGQASQKGRTELFRITRDRFRSAGLHTRTLVEMAIREMTRRTPGHALEKLKELLGEPSPLPR